MGGRLILAFQQVFEEFSCVLMTDSGVIDSKKWPKIPRKILLNQITELFEKNNFKKTDLTDIFVLNGPGDFTPLRNSMIVANTLKKELGLNLYTICKDQIDSEDLYEIFKKSPIQKADFIEPYFGKEPSIS
ncbi:MAG: hypothetical protein N4A36_02580 [Candidatus Gracilibacteria bacterium]|jgi:tRNA A37 threonylcarbamoyladenosine modification protein TsaB|nr:hypothetical protein [Candidatus Gracilibacteria bacterium]